MSPLCFAYLNGMSNILFAFHTHPRSATQDKGDRISVLYAPLGGTALSAGSEGLKVRTKSPSSCYKGFCVCLSKIKCSVTVPNASYSLPSTHISDPFFLLKLTAQDIPSCRFFLFPLLPTLCVCLTVNHFHQFCLQCVGGGAVYSVQRNPLSVLWENGGSTETFFAGVMKW